MKLKSILSPAKTIVLCGMCISLLTAQMVFASGKPYRTFTTFSTVAGEDDLINNNKEKNKSIFLRNNNSVKIYLDGPKKKVHVIAKENKGKQIDFFVFDLEGTLVYNHKMKMKDHHRITNLAKGIYVYRVFCGDEETASGQFEIK
jgi:hypothetical protein